MEGSVGLVEAWQSVGLERGECLNQPRASSQGKAEEHNGWNGRIGSKPWGIYIGCEAAAFRLLQ